MRHYEFILQPETLALGFFAAVFIRFLLEEDPDRWYWRAYLWTVAGVNIMFAALGPWGHIFGVLGTAVAPWVYFKTFHKRQFVLGDMLLFVLLFASMCTQIASGVYRENQPDGINNPANRSKIQD